ncbi:MAG: RNA methyltransferase, partial [Candidatus Eremiobacteraeota bacterium]|nr:RNA methyltransferase [Candidatus Eremiobacteraeota bacterium]
VLADLNDPGNAGTLLRSADAFGCLGVVLGSLGADPHQPKVVRAAMGAIFRMPFTLGEPETVALAAAEAGFEIAGLSAAGESIELAVWPNRQALVAGHERHGLGRWKGICARLLAIPMRGPAESLNAAVAGSIALFQASKRPIVD